jgi:hypothetical protein
LGVAIYSITVVTYSAYSDAQAGVLSPDAGVASACRYSVNTIFLAAAKYAITVLTRAVHPETGAGVFSPNPRVAGACR